MRFLHLADLHLGKNLHGFSLLEDQEKMLSQLAALAVQHKTDAVLIAGDVYDKAVPPAEAVQLLDHFLTELTQQGQKVFLISGNHDSAQRIAFGAQVMQKAGVYVSPVFSGCPQPITLTDAWGEVRLYLLPFIRPAQVRAALLAEEAVQGTEEAAAPAPENADAAQEQIERLTTYQSAMQAVMARMPLDPGVRNVLVAHQFLTGASPSDSEEFSVGGVENIDAALFRDFDYVALGHIHRAQQVEFPSIRYAGTPLKYSFSEAGQVKSATLVTLEEKGKLSIEELPLVPFRDCREIRGSYHEVTARENYRGTNTEDYVHITLTDEEEILQAVAKLRVIYPNLIRLDYDNIRTREHRSVEMPQGNERQSPMDLFEAFYQQQNNQEMTAQQRAFAESILQKCN